MEMITAHIKGVRNRTEHWSPDKLPADQRTFVVRGQVYVLEILEDGKPVQYFVTKQIAEAYDEIVAYSLGDPVEYTVLPKMIQAGLEIVGDGFNGQVEIEQYIFNQRLGQTTDYPALLDKLEQLSQDNLATWQSLNMPATMLARVITAYGSKPR
jgi:hypothetical protein